MPASSPSLTASDPGSAATAPVTHRVFIIDDHPIFRHGLKRLIELESDFQVVGEAASAQQALEGLRNTVTDAAVVDISLPGANGIELVKHLRAEHPKLPLLVISAHDEQLYALRALRAGASGYLMKREGDELFVAALRKVLSGQVWVSPAFGEQLIYKVARSDSTSGNPLDVLTDRELEILQHVGQGKSSQQIAETLHLSVKTVESHRLHIKEKLGLQSATELVRFAVEWNAQQEA